MRILLSTLVLSTFWLGCTSGSSGIEPAADAPKADVSAEPAAEEVILAEISVADAAEALQAGALALDANSDRTRNKYGTVPDAVILTSSSKYDLSQLPDDKSADMIFYCSNTKCTASDAAAKRASANGYENVHVMREGIIGWKEAGQPTTPYPQS